MDRSDVCYLVSTSYAQDNYGVMRETETERQVFCQVRSVSHSEKVENGMCGLYPTYQVSIFKYDYQMEEIVKYNGIKYTVYDATEWNDYIRLYIKREKGNE